jgi:hypothetical protein
MALGEVLEYGTAPAQFPKRLEQAKGRFTKLFVPNLKLATGIFRLEIDASVHPMVARKTPEFPSKASSRELAWVPQCPLIYLHGPDGPYNPEASDGERRPR